MGGKIEELQQAVMRYLQEYNNELPAVMKIFKDCMTELLSIADVIDKFHKGVTIASVTGSSVGIAGGLTSIVGLVLAPVTLGASLAVSAIGIGMAVAGGVTGATASIADTVHTKKKCSRVEEIVKELNMKLAILEEIKLNIECKFRDLETVLGVEQMENGGKIGGRGAFVAVELSRLHKLGRVTAAVTRGTQLVAEGAQALRIVSGVFAALFIVVDSVFIVKGATDLHKGCKTEAAAQIREIAHNLQKTLHDLKEQDKMRSSEYDRLLQYRK